MLLSEIPVSGPWGERHLLGLEHLSADQLKTVLDLAKYYDTITNGGSQRLDVLKGLVVANLFWQHAVWVLTRSILRPVPAASRKAKLLSTRHKPLKRWESIWLSVVIARLDRHICSPEI